MALAAVLGFGTVLFKLTSQGFLSSSSSISLFFCAMMLAVTARGTTFPPLGFGLMGDVGLVDSLAADAAVRGLVISSYKDAALFTVYGSLVTRKLLTLRNLAAFRFTFFPIAVISFANCFCASVKLYGRLPKAPLRWLLWEARRSTLFVFRAGGGSVGGGGLFLFVITILRLADFARFNCFFIVLRVG
jgi:hypothetical protein